MNMQQLIRYCRREYVHYTHLHEVANIFAIREYLAEVFRAENVTKSRLCQQSRRPVGVLDVRHRYRGVRDAVVDDRIDGNCDRVLGQDLCVHE